MWALADVGDPHHIGSAQGRALISPSRACPSPAPRRDARPSSQQGGRHSTFISRFAAAGPAPAKWFPGQPQQFAVGGLPAEPVTAKHGVARRPAAEQGQLAGRATRVSQRPRPAVRAGSFWKAGRRSTRAAWAPKAAAPRPGKVWPSEAIPTGKKSNCDCQARLFGCRRPKLGFEVGPLHADREHPRGFRRYLGGRIAFGRFSVPSMIMPLFPQGGSSQARPSGSPSLQPGRLGPRSWIVRARVPPVAALLARRAGEPFVSASSSLPQGGPGFAVDDQSLGSSIGSRAAAIDLQGAGGETSAAAPILSVLGRWFCSVVLLGVWIGSDPTALMRSDGVCSAGSTAVRGPSISF